MVLAAAETAQTALQQPLLLLLDDPDPRVRIDAAFALRQNHGAVSSKVLLDYLFQEKDDHGYNALKRVAGEVHSTGERPCYITLFKE